MRLALTWILATVLYGIVALALTPPDPLGRDAPPDRFSAERAQDLLAELLGDGSPRPIGSPGNLAMRERLVARLRDLAYEVEVQTAPAFENRPERIDVNNVVATLPGTDPSGVVLLNAHYDSVRAGPGVSDDGVGVAALLEVARIMKSGPAPKNTIVFLLDDGEEVGLRGAAAFCREHPLRNDIDVVLNFEARGTSGPSLMFETSGANGWLVDVFAQATEQPVTGSLFTTIYEALPNDTNLTAYKRAGIPGLNFAFISDPQNYHTEQDDLSHVTLGSMQHHGDHALALARAFGDLDFAGVSPDGDKVFFDVLCSFVVRWPEWLSLWLAIGLTLATLLIARAAIVRDAAGSLERAGLAWVAAIALPVALCALGSLALRWVGLMENNLVGNTLGYSTCYWVLSLAGFWLATRIGRSETSTWSLWIVSWSAYSLLAAATAVMAPGACYLFVFPLIVAVAAAIPAVIGRRQPGIVALVLPVLAAGLVWFTLHQFLPVALGVRPGWLLGGTHGLFLTTAIATTGRAVRGS